MTTPLPQAVARLMAVREQSPVEHQLQELVTMLRPLMQAHEVDLAALICGGLSRTHWGATEPVRFATDWLRTTLGKETAEPLLRRGRALDAATLITRVTTELDHLTPLTTTGTA